MKWYWILACVLCAQVAWAQQSDEPESVKVGFRSDAEPFSYRVPSESGGEVLYTGFIADLCYKIFRGSTYLLEAHEVTAEDRFSRLRPRHKDAEGEELDVVCDPITVRFGGVAGASEDDPDAHNKRRDKGVFSPIVFVSGVSYLRRNPNTRGIVQLGYLKGTTAVQAVETAKRADFLRALKSYKANQSSDQERPDATLRSLLNKVYQNKPLSSHSELISWFCSDDETSEGDQMGKVYFGDLDVIKGKLDAYRLSGERCDGVNDKGQIFTYEPYAILVTKERPDLIRHVQRRVYEIFSNRNEIVGLFSTHFYPKKMSEPLANLFLLNAVQRPSGRRAEQSDEVEESFLQRLFNQ